MARTTTTVHDDDLWNLGLGDLHHLQRLHDQADGYVRCFGSHWGNIAENMKRQLPFHRNLRLQQRKAGGKSRADHCRVDQLVRTANFFDLHFHTNTHCESFMIGSFVFGQLAHQVRTRKRGWLILTTFIQALFILVVALVERSSDEPRQGTGPRALAIVGLLSFAQAGQVSLAIGVGLAELNTTMITGAVVSVNPAFNHCRAY